MNIPNRIETPPRVSLRDRLRGRFTRTPLEERVRIVAAQARLNVTIDDDGLLEIQVLIANLSRRRLVIERFHCEQWLWNGEVLPGVEPHLRGEGTAVLSRGFGEALLTFQLGPQVTRRIREVTRPAPNGYSSVEANIEVFGRLWFRRWKNPIWLHLTPPNAQLSTQWADGPR